MSNRQSVPPIDSGTRIRIADEVIFAALGTEISLLNLQSGIYFTLNSVAAEIWRKIHVPTSLGELQRQLSAEYDAEPSRIEADLVRIVQELRENGLIEVSRP